MAGNKLVDGSVGAGGPDDGAPALLVTNFDIHAFHNELLEKTAMSGATSIDHDFDDLEIERSDGLRFVLETCERVERHQLLACLCEVLTPVENFHLEPLFRGADQEAAVPDMADLACFWLLRIGGLSFFETCQSPFDLAYHLADRLKLKSVEPDIPYVGFESFDTDSELTDEIRDRAWHLRCMNARQAWDHSGQRGAGIRIGHPDTGYTDHIDLDPARVRHHLGFDFVEMKPDSMDRLELAGRSAHGTATGSVIMSGGTIVSPPVSGQGGTGAPGSVTGLVPEAELVPVRIARSTQHVHASRLAQAIHHCRRRGCSVISVGMGTYPGRALLRAVQDAIRHHVIVVAAAGNRVGRSDGAIWPARYEDCIGLAASNGRDRPWLETSIGAGVDIAAPGEGIWRAIREDCDECHVRAGPASGTSFAAANAAGAAALWLGHHGHGKLIRMARDMGTTVQHLFRRCLAETARKPEGWDERCGAGILDVYRMLKWRPNAGGGSRAIASVRGEISHTLQHAFGAFGDHLDACLADMFKNPTGPDPIVRWGQELSLIARRLETSGDQTLARLRADTGLAAAERAEILKELVRPMASEALELELAGLPARH